MTEQSKNTSPAQQILKMLASVRLAIAVLIALSILSFIGAVVPQNASPVEYVKTFGEGPYRIIDMLGFNHMFSSFMFNLLLGLFALNLIVCTLERLPHAWSRFRGPAGSLIEKAPRNTRIKAELTIQGTMDDAVKKISRLLGRPATEVAPDQAVLLSSRGRYGLLAPYVTHLSILIIVAGALVGVFMGFRGFIWLVQGSQSDHILSSDYQDTIPLGFEVRCDEFIREVYEDSGMDKDYKSTLTVIKNGTPVTSKTIEVNHPLFMGSIGIYQQRWGRQVARFIVEDAQAGTTEELRIPLGEFWTLPEHDAIYVPTDYRPQIEGMGRSLGPMISLDKFENGMFKESIKLFRDVPDFDRREREGQAIYYFQFMGVDDEEWTGLEVVNDPGLPLIWIGFTLISLGICLSFVIIPRRIWVRISKQESGLKVQVMATGRKARTKLEKEVSDLAQKIKA